MRNELMVNWLLDSNNGHIEIKLKMMTQINKE